MIDYLPIKDGNDPLIERMAQPDIRIVAMTVSEGGYFVHPATKGFDETHPEIVHDSKNPDHSTTVFGAIIAALRIRRDRGTGPFTCLCCDNLLGNGDVLRQVVVSLARMSDPELALALNLGIDDQAPVTLEKFRQ